MQRRDAMLEQYVLAAMEHDKATREGDYRNANRQYAKLTKIYRQLAVDEALAKDFLAGLFSHKNPCVRIWAAAHALGLGVETKEAAYTLQQLSEDPSFGIVQLDAEMTLREWIQKGKLNF